MVFLWRRRVCLLIINLQGEEVAPRVDGRVGFRWIFCLDQTVCDKKKDIDKSRHALAKNMMKLQQIWLYQPDTRLSSSVGFSVPRTIMIKQTV